MQRRQRTPLVGIIALAFPWYAACAEIADTSIDPHIRWLTCNAALTGDWPDLGDRLRCARFLAPLDHVQPDGRTIDVGAIRIAAADPARREGTLFMNIGGPGGNPVAYVVPMVNAFGNIDPDDPLHGDKRRLVDRFDIVAVIPRGLKGGWTYECRAKLRPTHAFLPTHRDDTNWQRLLDDTAREVAACTAQPEARFINTEQHVHDMDMVRRALGDERIHFYGVSHGGLVGAWYAAMYPEHLGRMLLDSSFAFTRPYRDAVDGTLDAQRRAFEEDMIGPIDRERARFGQPADADLIAEIRDLPWQVRAAWHEGLISPHAVAAALTMSRWIHRRGWAGWDDLDRHVEQGEFTDDPDTNTLMWLAASELVLRGRADRAARRGDGVVAALPGRPRWQGPLIDVYGESVNTAMLCNDGGWHEKEWQIRARADRNASSYPLSDGSEIKQRLLCLRWGDGTARKPDFDALARRPPFLLIHADGDTATPLAGVGGIVDTYANAHLIVAEGSRQHGLFGLTSTPCIEHGATRYLLYGELPPTEGRASSCAFVAAGFDEDTSYRSGL